ncbi:hypothetical protein VTK56DRAFT_8711 [Thermocarpiscus australiensis]
MPAARKRSLQELDSHDTEQPQQPSTLHRIRNMWQFANLFQFIFLFGKALKLDDNLDIEDLEAECLKPGSMALQDIGLGFLKFLSSHRGLTHELFDEYTRRQFLSKAPEKNPFGTAETPARFADFDVFTKIRVLQQMTQFIMMHPERLRERTEEQKDMDQTDWRIEPCGWDRQDRTYFVLDDNRLYRMTDAPPPPPKPKKNTKKARAAQRASKRRRISSEAASDTDDAGDEAPEGKASTEREDDGLGGMKWECVAVTLDEVRAFLSTLQKSRDPNEQVLRGQIQNHLVPILEKQEESRKRKQLQRERELLNLEKMAHAKRSSRIASKLEQQRMEERAREEERRRREEEAARKQEELRRMKMERERDHRLMSREQRLKEREARRRRHEEELAQLSEDSKGASSAFSRMSERRRQAEIERNKKALQELEEEEEDWIFDCVCGVYGQVDDGTHSVACERCNIWQHSKCLGINEEEADRDDFHFICSSCRRRLQAPNEPHPRIIKIKVNRQPQPASPPTHEAAEESATTSHRSRTQLVVELQSRPSANLPDGSDQLRAVPSGSFRGDVAARPAQLGPPNAPEPTGSDSADAVSASPLIQHSSAGQSNNLFSSPHPSLLPPDRRPVKSDAPNLRPVDPAPALAGSGDRRPGLVDESAVPNGALFTLAGNGSGSSPSKQPQRPSSPTTKAPSATLNGLGATVSAGDISGMTSTSTVLPHTTPAHPANATSYEGPPPLPPPSAGLSPTKQSPPIPQPHVNGGSNTAPAPLAGTNLPPAVFPPVTALTPSPRQQISMPPVKPVEPVRVPPQQLAQGMQTPKLGRPASSDDRGRVGDK